MIADLAWIMFAGAAVIFLVVVAILVYALLTRPERRPRINGMAFIVAGGVALPVVTLSILLFFVMRVGAEVSRAPGPDALTVEVVGHQWWWEFRYLFPDRALNVVTANELHIPAGRRVQLRLKTADVIHTFWAPNLAGKRDLVPGAVNTLTLQADRSGLFRGQCNEFCGAQHALMRFYVISQPPADFERWLQAQRAPADAPATPLLRTGHAGFIAAGCPLCHTVRGTGARGTAGPDLTHFGGRRTIAAGTLKNTQGNREAWIVSSQHLKPDNKMPNYYMEGEMLRAVAAYLGSLE